MSTHEDKSLVAGPIRFFWGHTATGVTGAVNDGSNIAVDATTITYDGIAGALLFSATGRLKWVTIDDEKMLVTADSGTVLTVVRGYQMTTAAIHLDDAVITEYGFTEYKTLDTVEFSNDTLNNKVYLKSSQYGVEEVYGQSEDESPSLTVNFVEWGYEQLKELFAASQNEIIDSATADVRYFEVMSKAGINLSSSTLSAFGMIVIKSKISDNYTMINIPKMSITDFTSFSFGEEQIQMTVKMDMLLQTDPITSNQIYYAIGDIAARA